MCFDVSDVLQVNETAPLLPVPRLGRVECVVHQGDAPPRTAARRRRVDHEERRARRGDRRVVGAVAADYALVLPLLLLAAPSKQRGGHV